MDGPRDFHTVEVSQKKRNIIDIAKMQNPKNKKNSTNELIYKTE